MRIDNQGYIQFGMHKGCHIYDLKVPANYLQWCVDNVHLTGLEYEAVMQEIVNREREADVAARSREADTARRQKAQAEEEAGRRKAEEERGRRQAQQDAADERFREARRRYNPGRHEAPPPPAPKASTLVCPATLLRVIATGRGQLARLCHPDAGGDPQEMVRINNAADYLEAVARGLQAKRA